jgi:hypothetical protein
MLLAKAATGVNYSCNMCIIQVTVATVVNYNSNMFIVQTIGFKAQTCIFAVICYIRIAKLFKNISLSKKSAMLILKIAK